MDPQQEQERPAPGQTGEERQNAGSVPVAPGNGAPGTAQQPAVDGQQAPAPAADAGGRASGGAAYDAATRDKVRGSDYGAGKGIVGAAPPGAGYDQTKRAVQPPRPEQAALPTVPAESVQAKIIELLSYGWTDVVVTDADATEAFRLLSIAGDKSKIMTAMRAEGVYERLWQNLPRTALTSNFQRTLSVYKALPEAEKLTRMSELLAIGLTDWAVDDRELWLVVEVLDTMSPTGRKAFVQKDGGVWYAKLMGAQIPDAPPPNQVEAEDKSWTEMAADALAAGGEFVQEIAADPGAAIEELKRGGTFAVNLIVDGEIDLNYAQEKAGGSLGGITLAEGADNRVDLGIDTDAGHADVAIAQLGIAAIETNAGGMVISTGGGAITGVHGQLKWATAQDASSGVRFDIAGLALTNLHVTSETLELVLPLLALNAVHVAVERPLSQQATPTSPAEAAVLAGQELVLLVDDWLPAMSALGTAPGQDPETLSQRVAESFGGAMNYELTLGSAVLSGLHYSERGEDGAMREVASVGEATISGVSAKLEHGDSLVVLGQERATLQDKAKSGRLGAAEADRLAFLDAELQALQGVRARADELSAKQKAGGLSQQEQDELITANNRLRTGIVHVQAQMVEVRDATYKGDSVAHAKVAGVSAQAASASLGHNELTSGEQAAADAKALQSDSDALDTVLDRSKRGTDVARSNAATREAERAAEAKASADAAAKARAAAGIAEPSVAAGVGANVHIASAEVQGANAQGVQVGSASVRDLDARAAEDASELHLGAADVADLSGSKAGKSGTLQAGHVGNLALHQNGSDVGGYVGNAGVDGLHAKSGDDTIDLAHGGVRGVRADVDTAAKRARSASVEHVDVDGASYQHGATKAKVGSLDIDNLSGTGITSHGADSVHLGNLAARDAAYRDDTLSLQSGSLGIRDANATGVTGHGAKTAAIGGLSASNTDYAEGETKVHADGLQLQGIAGQNLASGGKGALQVDQIGAQGLRGGRGDTQGSVSALSVQGAHANVDDRGTVAGFAGAKLDGVAGSVGSGANKQSGSVGSLALGDSAVALDEHDVLQGARIDGLNASHLRAHVLRSAGAPASAASGSGGSAASGAQAQASGGAAAAPAERFHADALAGASGTFRAHVPVDWEPMSFLGGYVGNIDVTAQAKDGRINLEDVHISGEGVSGFAGRIGSSVLRIEEGRGLVAEFFLFRFILADSRDYGGLQSHREGGSRKGTLLLQRFAESMMNPKVELTENAHAAVRDAQRGRSGREERRTQREQRRGERQAARGHTAAPEPSGMEKAETYVDVGKTRVDISGLKLGSGLVGTDSAHATLTSGGSATNRFELHTTLGKSATATAARIAAKDLHATDPDGRPIDAATLGIDGLQVDVLRPLSENADITVVVDGLNVTQIRVGDQTRLR